MAIDPGVSSGMAWRGLKGWTDDAYVTTVAPDPEKVYQTIQHIQPEILIVEWFITGQRLNEFSRRTIETCGGCEAMAFMVGAQLVKHTPKTRYPMMDEAERILIERWGPRGTTVKGRGTFTDHQQDALAHLLVYKAKLELPPTKEPALPRATPPRR